METMVALSSFVGASVVGRSAVRSLAATRRRALVVRAQAEVKPFRYHTLPITACSPMCAPFLTLSRCPSARHRCDQGDHCGGLLSELNPDPDPQPDGTQAQAQG